MEIPKLNVWVEPWEGAAVRYLPLAARAANDEPGGLVALQLTIENQEAHDVHLNGVTVSFESLAGSYGVDTMVNLPAGRSTNWSHDETNCIELPLPVPASLTLTLECESPGGPCAPWQVTVPLAAYAAPRGGYLFPTVAPTLPTGDLWMGGSGLHAGSAFDLDLTVIGVNSSAGTWSELRGGPDAYTVEDLRNNLRNEDFLVWGKPICAIADGVVIKARDGVPANENPFLWWENETEYNEKIEQQRQDYWGGFANGAAGNYFKIQHGDVVVLYAHLQAGSLAPGLLTPGCPVKAGEFLGSAGNSGRGNAPHLHLQAVKENHPGPDYRRWLPFRDLRLISLETLLATPDAPWTWVGQGRGLPATRCVIWAAPTLFASDNLRFHESAIQLVSHIVKHAPRWKPELDFSPGELVRGEISELVAGLSPTQKKRALASLKKLSTTYLRRLDEELRRG